jgi:hypothetical protein
LLGSGQKLAGRATRPRRFEQREIRRAEQVGPATVAHALVQEPSLTEERHPGEHDREDRPVLLVRPVHEACEALVDLVSGAAGRERHDRVSKAAEAEARSEVGVGQLRAFLTA